MKKRWYKKSGLKGLMVCLTIVALVVGCVCGGASILLMSKGIRPLDSRKYVDSERFTGKHVRNIAYDPGSTWRNGDFK